MREWLLLLITLCRVRIHNNIIIRPTKCVSERQRGQSKAWKIQQTLVSLGDVITLIFLIKNICNPIGFESKFRSEFLESKLIVSAKSIISFQDVIENYEKDQKYIKSGRI